MLHISTQKLIEKLLERTQNGTIDWKEREPDGVTLETEGYVVELTASPSNVKLSHIDGRVLEDVPHEILESATNQDGRTYADIVAELAGEADRFAKGTEQAIASILDAVESSNTPVLKTGPRFIGQPQTSVESPVPAPAVEDAADLTQSEDTSESEPETDLVESDPFTEAGMSAAVGKMVAEINGDPAGDELDFLEDEASLEPTIPPEEMEPVPSDEFELSASDAEALLSAQLPDEPIAIEEEVPTIEEDTLNPAIAATGLAAMSAMTAAASLNDETVSETDDDLQTEIDETVELEAAVNNLPDMDLPELESNDLELPEPSLPDIDIDTLDEIEIAEPELPITIDTLEAPALPSTPDLADIEAISEDETILDIPEAEGLELIPEDEDIAPPPPLDDLPSSDLNLATDEDQSEDDFSADIETEIVEEAEPIATEHFQPFAKRTAELAAAQLDEKNPAPIQPDIESAELEELAPVLNTPIEREEIEATTEVAPQQAPAQEEAIIAAPKEEPVEPSSIGFAFRNKVTATGLAIGGNVGTLISGVPDDVRQRVDDHERIVRLQREKAEAEERAIKAKKAAEDAANARKSSVGFKSWS